MTQQFVGGARADADLDPIGPTRRGDREPDRGGDGEDLAATVAAGLGLDAAPDPDEDLFTLGLDSLTVIRLAAAWRRRGIAVTFEDLALHPTLRAWRELLAGEPDGLDPTSVDTSSVAPVATAGSETDDALFDLAPMQHAYWVGRHDGQPWGGVGSHFCLEFDGHDVDPARLAAAWRRVLARHDLLRVILTADGRQRIAERTAFAELTVHDLRELDPAAEQARLAALRAHYAHRRMDPERGEVVELALSLRPGGATRLHLDLDMIAADAASLTVLLADLAAFYVDPAAAPPELRHDVRTHLAQRAADPARAARREQDRAWWGPRLDDLPGPPALPRRPDPTDGRGAAPGTVVGLRHHHRLDPAATAAFTAHARAAGLTPSAALTTVFAEVVAAFAGPRFVLNLPLFDRGEDQRAAGLVGDFTSATLLPVDLAQARPLAEQARAVQAELHGVVAHAGFSALDVLRERGKRLGAPALAPVVHTSALGLGDLEPAAVRAAFGRAGWVSSQNPQVWLDAQVRESAGGLLLNWDERAGVLVDGVGAAMFAAYRDLVAGLAADPAAWDRPVGSLVTAVSTENRAAVNATDRTVARRALHAGFFAHARTRPDAVAVVGDVDDDPGRGDPDDHGPAGWSISYGRLADRALRVAAALLDHGLQPGEPVVLVTARGIDQLVAVLGVLAAGGCYVPIGPDQPAVRRARIVAGAGARLALVDGPDHRLGGAVTVLRIADAQTGAAADGPVLLDPDSPCYVLFTSGSTGEPKGVQVSHAAVVNTVESVNARVGVGPADRALLVSSLEFDLSAYDLFGMWSAGGAVVLLPEPERRDPQAWWRRIAAHRVSVWSSVPVLLEMLLAAAPPHRPDVALRVAMVGGDRVDATLPTRWHALAPSARFVALGGMTETAIHCTWREVGPGEALPTGSAVDWGTPLDNQVCRVVDDRGRDCPDGVGGTLWVGGASVATGYRGDPDRTADRFVTHAGRRWFRSGDLARYRPDGTLEFLGRADHQVKVRGHRIELGEVEAALSAHPQVGRAVVVVLERPTRRLAAVVSPAAGAAAPDPADLVAWQAQRLVPVMVCEQVLVCDRFPVTDTGKLDRAGAATLLADAGDRAAPTGPAGGPPRSAAERAVAAVWAGLLDVTDLGRDDDFFALGGDSLVGTRLLGRLAAAGWPGARIGALFAGPRLREFAATLPGPAAASPADPATSPPAEPAAPPPAGSGAPAPGPAAVAPDVAPPVVVPDPARRHEPFPGTDVQRAYLSGRDPRFALGGVGTWQYAEFDGVTVDLARLRWAWQQLVGRHEMLRAVVEPDGDLRIRPARDLAPVVVAVQDLSAADTDAGAAALERMRAESSHRLLDPAGWPPFELRAVRYRDAGGAVRTRIGIGLDYLHFDALSIMTLFTELDRLYTDPATVLAPIELSFRDYALQVRPDPAAVATATAHWTDRLATLPGPPLLPLRQDPALIRAPRFTRRTHRLDPQRWARLGARARGHGLTRSTVLLAAYTAVLAAWSETDAFSITLTLFDRREVHPHIDRVLGDFTSLTLADHRPAPDWLSGARAMQQRLAADLDHRDVSPSWLLRERATRTGTRDATGAVVFTSAVGVGDGVSMDPSPGFPARVFGLSQSPQVALDNQVMESGGGLQVAWEAVEDLFAEGVLDAMFTAHARLLTHLADTEDWAAPRPAVVDTATLERRARPAEPVPPLPGPGLLHAPFFAAARTRADAPALITADEVRSHGELAEQALRVAATLAADGVRAGDAVAISLPKGPDQIVAVLGVLAAGAVYVPLGLDLPPAVRAQAQRSARVVRMIDDLAPLLRVAPAAAPVPRAPTDTAYVIFTSGSTGQRKGVELSHGAAAHTVADVAARCGIGPSDRVLAVSALDFDLSVFDVFGLLGAGGAVVLPAEDHRRDARAWLALCHDHAVTIWNSVPLLLEMLLVAAGPAGPPPTLRLALVSGDWVALDLGARLGAHQPAVPPRLLALGGATEAAIWSNLCEVPVGQPAPAHWPSVPYGRPLTGQRYRVVAPDGTDRPDQVPGELWIGGTGVALGYRGDPERTADRFVDAAGQRWYRTGDLGRWWPDATVEFLGRRDHQVKISGHRLELGEVEAALHEHPAVARAVVVAVGPRIGRRLHALLIPATGADLDGVELAAFLSRRLPAHAVPPRHTVLDRLPLGPTGKLDRDALTRIAERDDDPTTAGAARTGGAPNGPVERELAELWAELLAVDIADRGADFFAMGGTSLTALRMITAVERRFGARASVGAFLAEPTVAALARQLAVGDAGTDAAEVEVGVL